MKRNDLLRAAGLAVLLLILIFLFLRNPAPRSVSRVSGPAEQPSSLSRTDTEGRVWTLDLAGGGSLTSTDPNVPKPGAPILVKTDVQRVGAREVSIGLVLEGQAGEQYRPVVKKNGQATTAPALRVVNEAGQVVAQGDFQYGWGGSCRYTWRVPDNFSGKFQVQVDLDLGPIEAQHDRPWHSL